MAESKTTDTTAACCANFYEQDIIQELLGGSYHPGGENLSGTLARSLGLKAGQTVLDVACGVGTTSRLMSKQLGLCATGLDFSKINVGKAEQLSAEQAESSTPDAAESTPLFSPGELKFVEGSADDLPFDDGQFDGLVCECAVSTFADQSKAANEFFRVLKPGGVFGMTDMVLNGELPEKYAEQVAPWTCMAKALDSDGYSQLFTEAGFQLIDNQDFSHTLIEMATDIKRKLVMAGVGKALGAIGSLGMSLSEMRAMLSQSTELVNAETIQYRLLLFRK
ncbi:methyltransferase domain-containing protein [Mariniblastus sp.]|nr:methyltransferase domain-containing protein [Mariniblastus sp.]